MSGEGKFPFRSGWFGASQTGQPFPLYKSIQHGNNEGAGATAFNDWFFGAAAGGGAVGLATETDTAFALAGVQLRSVGLATESDSALALSGKIIGAVGLATETDTAFALTSGASGSVGLATETDTALALGGVLVGAVGMAVETDTALALSSGSGDPIATAIYKILHNRQELDPVLGKLLIYDDDGSTVLYQADAWENVDATIRYRGREVRRIDALVP